MINVPINAMVECTDGSCGESTCLVINPVTEKITHIVVKENAAPQAEYLVPMEQVVETTSDLIKLACTQTELKRMEPFTETQFVKTLYYSDQYGWDAGMAWPYTTPVEIEVPLEVDRVPEGKLAVRRGAYVQATDGLVGPVDEFLLDPDSGHITHLVLREGHLWGQKILTLPVSLIDKVEGADVYLKVDKQTIEALPAIPVKQRYGLTNSELLILTLDELDKAREALATLRELIKGGMSEILNAALLAKSDEGKTSLNEIGDVGARQGTLFGAVAGGLIGLLAGPVGALVGAAAGAATGRAAAKRIDLGLPDEYLATLQAGLQPGSSAVVVVVEQEGVEKVIGALSQFEGQLLRQTFTDEILAQLAVADKAKAADSEEG